MSIEVTGGLIATQERLLLRRHVLAGPTMGTRYSATFYTVGERDLSAVHKALQAAVDRVDNVMSTWKPDSDLNRLSRSKPGEWTEVPRELCHVLKLGLAIGKASGGAFDIGMRCVVDAWGFGPRRGGPHSAAIEVVAEAEVVRADAALEIVGARVRLNQTIGLDLSGIAKGYGVDRLAEVLDRLGIARYLVSIDGELSGRGLKPGGEPWAVGLEAPIRGRRESVGTLPLGDRALATSGDYRHWVAVDGAEYSHSIDPRTRRPVRNRVASVTVAATTCAQADAWATALLVLGEVNGPAKARQLGLDALFLVREGEGTVRQVAVGRLQEFVAGR